MSSAYSPRWFAKDEPVHRQCDVPGCHEKGEHKAPKSRASSKNREYHWFCIQHVTAYNKSWNYFDGMSDVEMERFWGDAATHDRPTWQRDGGRAYSSDRLEFAMRNGFADYFAAGEAGDGAQKRVMPVDRRVTDALAVLNLNWPVTVEEMKAQYKVLAKKYHPDVNSSPGAEDRFKKVTEAYQKLKEFMEKNL